MAKTNIVNAQAVDAQWFLDLNRGAATGELVDGSFGTLSAITAGGTTAYTLALALDGQSLPSGSYQQGLMIKAKINTTNTGAVTIDVNTLGAKAVKTMDGRELGEGDLVATRIYCFIYDATLGWFVLLNSLVNHAFSVNLGGADQVGIVDSTFTKVLFDNIDFDDNSEFDIVTNNRFQAKRAGKVVFMPQARLIGLNDQKRLQVGLEKNGVLQHSSLNLGSAAATDDLGIGFGVVMEMNGSTDFVEMVVRHTHGSNRDIDGNVITTFLTGFYIQ